MSIKEENKARPEDIRRNRESGEQGREPDPLEGATVIPAIRHIGKTLESDPEYYAIATPGYSTPEAQIAAEAARWTLISAGWKRMISIRFQVVPSRIDRSR